MKIRQVTGLARYAIKLRNFIIFQCAQVHFTILTNSKTILMNNKTPFSNLQPSFTYFFYLLTCYLLFFYLLIYYLLFHLIEINDFPEVDTLIISKYKTNIKTSKYLAISFSTLFIKLEILSFGFSSSLLRGSVLISLDKRKERVFAR